jgi:hypothetical protein
VILAALYKQIEMSYPISKLFALCVFLNEICAYTYDPYGITFNSSGFEWQGDGNFLNIPGYDIIAFLFIVSMHEPIAEIKYGVRIVSPVDNTTLLQRPIYINKTDFKNRVLLVVASQAIELNVVIRGLVKVPKPFLVAGDSANVWTVQDTDVVYTGRYRRLIN